MNNTLRRFLARRKAIGVAVLLVSCAAVAGIIRYSRRAPPVATYRITRGEFLDVLQLRGQSKAMKSVEINAPPDVDTLQILTIASDGAHVKPGETIVQFDSSKAKEDLAKDKSAMKSAQAEIDQARAQALLTEEKDTTAVMKARFAVQTARLDAGKREILSQIDGAEAELKLADAQQALNQAEAKLESDQLSDRATIADKIEASGKARYDVTRAAQTLAAMTLRSPSSGTISLVPVWHNGGVGPFKAGEQIWSGAPIAEIPDAASLRVTTRLDETERGRLAVGQPVTVQVDAIDNRQFTGKVVKIGTIATEDFSAGWPIPRNFDVEIALNQTDPRLKPNMTAQITVIVDRVPNSISIPAEASFVQSGQTVAYVWDGSAFRARPIQIARRDRDRILVAHGLRSGDLIALTDPRGTE
jgi:HlyD family secretion protein